MCLRFLLDTLVTYISIASSGSNWVGESVSAERLAHVGAQPAWRFACKCWELAHCMGTRFLLFSGTMNETKLGISGNNGRSKQLKIVLADTQKFAAFRIGLESPSPRENVFCPRTRSPVKEHLKRWEESNTWRTRPIISQTTTSIFKINRKQSAHSGYRTLRRLPENLFFLPFETVAISKRKRNKNREDSTPNSS